ncbi:MAG: thioesterase [Fimbriimonadales bacterium]|nr:MAG: thioesterase [Fimbriimonadales bacterium]GIV08957.1 MAG: thioesterase [Fimbriimonadales bacterium]
MLNPPTVNSPKSLQETYAPNSICYGCGPANRHGLRIRSFATESGELIAEWQPQPHHQAFAGVLNGGVIGTLLDCHCNWTAAYHLMTTQALEQIPPTVTAEYTIKMLRPTPTDTTLHLRARPVEAQGSKVIVEGEIIANGEVCATCRGVFVAVKPGHPAYHRWE